MDLDILVFLVIFMIVGFRVMFFCGFFCVGVWFGWCYLVVWFMGRLNINILLILLIVLVISLLFRIL